MTELDACEIDWVQGPKGWEMKERPGTDFTLKADLVLLAMGFVHVVPTAGLVESLGVELDPRGNVKVADWMTSKPGVFAAGDTVRGASLVVHAINHGRQAAAAVDKWLKANSPVPDGSDYTTARSGRGVPRPLPQAATDSGDVPEASGRLPAAARSCSRTLELRVWWISVGSSLPLPLEKFDDQFPIGLCAVN